MRQTPSSGLPRLSDSRFTTRLAGVLRLQVSAFEEVEADRTATGQALLVIVLASLSAGVGAGLGLGAGALVRATLAATVGWLVWAVLIYFIGTRLLPEPQTRSNLGELLRVIGFAAAPGLFLIFAFIPILGWLIQIGVALWLLMTMIIGVRQALDFRSTSRAVGVVLAGWVFYIVLLAVF